MNFDPGDLVWNRWEVRGVEFDRSQGVPKASLGGAKAFYENLAAATTAAAAAAAIAAAAVAAATGLHLWMYGIVKSL